MLALEPLAAHAKRVDYELERAMELARRIESCYTPKHSSWLIIAEPDTGEAGQEPRSGPATGLLEPLEGLAVESASACALRS